MKIIFSRRYIFQGGSFCFSGFANSLLKYKKFFKLGARKFHFPKYKTFFQSGFFKIFLSSKLLPEIWEVSWNIRNFFGVSVSPNIRKAFFWENIKNFLILELESFISWNVRKYKNFFRSWFSLFFELGLKSFISWNTKNCWRIF